MKNSFPVGLMTMVLLMAGVSCIPLFENPLPATPENMSDPALLGTWIGTGENADCQVSFIPRSSGWLDAVYLTGINLPAQTNGLDNAIYEGYTARVGERRMLCLRSRSRDYADSTEPPADYPYMLLGYSIDNGSELTISIMSEAAVREKIESGEWPGQVEGGSSSNEVRVTFSSEELADALNVADIGGLLTDSPLTFKRCE